MMGGSKLFATGAVVGALVASAVTAEAATHWLITSPSQIKPGTLTLKDFSKRARHGLQGAQGPKGVAGQQGPKGDPGSPGPPSTPGPGSVKTMYAQLPEGQSATLLSSATIGQIDATCTHHVSPPLVTTTITYNDTTGQTVGIFTRAAADTVPAVQPLTAGQTLPTVLSNSSDILTLHVQYGASAATSHVGTADIWVYQTPGTCVISGVLTSNDTS